MLGGAPERKRGFALFFGVHDGDLSCAFLPNATGSLLVLEHHNKVLELGFPKRPTDSPGAAELIAVTFQSKFTQGTRMVVRALGGIGPWLFNRTQRPQPRSAEIFTAASRLPTPTRSAAWSSGTFMNEDKTPNFHKEPHCGFEVKLTHGANVQVGCIRPLSFQSQ